MKILVANHMERCICCHSCSLACARLVYSTLSWTHAGIRIHSSGGMTTGFEAAVCLACKDAPCARVCPSGALTQRRGGGIIYKRSVCIGCRDCVTACPVDAILPDRESGLPYVCIHCGRCVSFCPRQCLAMLEVDDGKQPKPGPAEGVTGTAAVTGPAMNVAADASQAVPGSIPPGSVSGDAPGNVSGNVSGDEFDKEVFHGPA